MKAGLVLLSIWSGLNFVLAMGILAAVCFFGQYPPSIHMVFNEVAMNSIDPKALSLIFALAILFNACAASFCGLVFVAIWKGIAHRVKWTFWAVAGSMSFLQVFGFVSDTYLGNQNLAANGISSLILLGGLVLTGRDVYAR